VRCICGLEPLSLLLVPFSLLDPCCGCNAVVVGAVVVVESVVLLVPLSLSRPCGTSSASGGCSSRC
jgi:hypothetical protein